MTIYLIAMGVFETLGNVPPGWLALCGTVIGTLGLKLLEKRLNKGKEQIDVRKDFREEITQLRDANNQCQVRLDKVEEEVTFWRNRFYEEQEENSVLRVMLINKGIEPPAKRVIPPSQQM